MGCCSLVQGTGICKGNKACERYNTEGVCNCKWSASEGTHMRRALEYKDHSGRRSTDDKKTNDAIASLYEGRAKVPVGIILKYL